MISHTKTAPYKHRGELIVGFQMSITIAILAVNFVNSTSSPRSKADGDKRHPEREKDKQAKLEAAQHCQEGLSDDECEEHVDQYVDALSCRPDFNWEDLVWYQPTERAP
ncbi:hypothetical protein Vadar_031210 [Vaccinium darrowii]|uniref:Uncharacterized protein n=1 Tax=Vaccinium darrowii TaxID=229202 RepID=A0ACB7YZP8_9ERIC|nr:hypothetical protein Vadar_031210 [Vaccinium darrowii]